MSIFTYSVPLRLWLWLLHLCQLTICFSRYASKRGSYGSNTKRVALCGLFCTTTYVCEICTTWYTYVPICSQRVRLHRLLSGFHPTYYASLSRIFTGRWVDAWFVSFPFSPELSRGFSGSYRLHLAGLGFFRVVAIFPVWCFLFSSIPIHVRLFLSSVCSRQFFWSFSCSPLSVCRFLFFTVQGSWLNRLYLAEAVDWAVICWLQHQIAL